MPRLCSSLLLSLWIASSASAVTIDWTPIGDPGNACDPQSGGCYGAVGYSYNIGTYEVTNVQYAEFLNAVGSTGDYRDLPNSGSGGIARSGSSGSFTYSTIPGRENVPVTNVTFYDALRFANWLHNGQPTTPNRDATDQGVYTFNGPSAVTARNPGATVFLTSEDEWYKAAYYDAQSASYEIVPFADANNVACEPPPGTTSYSANCDRSSGDSTDVGAYTSSPSAHGTFDQGGNVAEWNETIRDAAASVRGGSYMTPHDFVAASERFSFNANTGSSEIGFRVASIIPEPSTGLLVIAGLLGLAAGRRARAKRDPFHGPAKQLRSARCPTLYGS